MKFKEALNESEPTSKRLDILIKSLEKKEKEFDDKIQNHFDTVKQANGQPLNDKRNGQATLNKWERQNDSLRNMQDEIEKTKQAIEIEKGKIYDVEASKEYIPKEIQDLVSSGVLTQWRKHPGYFFVNGVDKARIIWDDKKKQVMYKYLKDIPDKDQYKKFAQVYNSLNQTLNKK